MKRCPTCNKTFTDRNLSYCIDDGTPLVPVPEQQPTVVSPAQGSGSSAPGSQTYGSSWKAPAYQPPGGYVPPVSNGTRRRWPWVVGIIAALLICIVGLGVAAAIIVPRMLRASANRKRPAANINIASPGDTNSNSNLNTNANKNSNSNSNLNTNANENSNSNESSNEAAPAPSDYAAVLSELTDLEHEWTAANINADKKALNRILADDYVGITDGKQQGKAQYLREIKRDTTIQKWDFDDLKLDLKGDRATLTGIVKFVVNGQELQFHFSDKFVWRDGRWQATASQVDPIK